MEKSIKESFLNKWTRYFGSSELPVFYYYSNDAEQALNESHDEDQCLIGNLNQVRGGKTFVYSVKSPGCAGGKRYAGLYYRF